MFGLGQCFYSCFSQGRGRVSLPQVARPDSSVSVPHPTQLPEVSESQSTALVARERFNIVHSEQHGSGVPVGVSDNIVNDRHSESRDELCMIVSLNSNQRVTLRGDIEKNESSEVVFRDLISLDEIVVPVSGQHSNILAVPVLKSVAIPGDAERIEHQLFSEDSFVSLCESQGANVMDPNSRQPISREHEYYRVTVDAALQFELREEFCFRTISSRNVEPLSSLSLQHVDHGLGSFELTGAMGRYGSQVVLTDAEGQFRFLPDSPQGASVVAVPFSRSEYGLVSIDSFQHFAQHRRFTDDLNSLTNLADPISGRFVSMDPSLPVYSVAQRNGDVVLELVHPVVSDVSDLMASSQFKAALEASASWRGVAEIRFYMPDERLSDSLPLLDGYFTGGALLSLGVRSEVLNRFPDEFRFDSDSIAYARGFSVGECGERCFMKVEFPDHGQGNVDVMMLPPYQVVSPVDTFGIFEWSSANRVTPEGPIDRSSVPWSIMPFESRYGQVVSGYRSVVPSWAAEKMLKGTHFGVTSEVSTVDAYVLRDPYSEERTNVTVFSGLLGENGLPVVNIVSERS